MEFNDETFWNRGEKKLPLVPAVTLAQRKHLRKVLNQGGNTYAKDWLWMETPTRSSEFRRKHLAQVLQLNLGRDPILCN